MLIKSSFCIGRRYVSQLFVRPRPRPYKKRLFDAALAPILPKNTEEEWKKLNDPYNIHAVSPPYTVLGENEFTPYELALVEKTRQWILDESFRVMAICHLNYIKEHAFWLGKNQFRKEEIELSMLPCKMLRKLFEGTPFRCFNHLLVDGCTCILFGKHFDAIATIISQCDHYSWISPIVVTFDQRILTMEQANELAYPDSMQRLRAQIVQTLGYATKGVPSTLDRAVGQTSSLLNSHISANV